MPVLELTAVSSVQKVTDNLVDVYEVFGVTSIECMTFPDHAITITQSRVESLDRWNGEVQSKTVWLPGDMAFLPASGEMSSQAICGEGGFSTIRIKSRLFTEAAKGCDVYFDRVPLRFMPLNSRATLQLGTVVRNIAMSDELRAWSMLLDTASLALAVSVIKDLSPYASKVIEHLKNGMCRKRAQRVVDYIDEHINENITLDDLAGVAALSRYHFLRSFKQTFGVTPMRYVAQRRIENAKRLLIDPSIPMSAVAMQSGFASQQHFCTSFKAAAGITPTAYRQAEIQRLRGQESALPHAEFGSAMLIPVIPAKS